MASYRIEISKTAERQIRHLAEDDRIRVIDAISRLAADPRPRGYRKLRGYEDVFRIRVGTLRVLYSIKEAQLLVMILKVGHRRDIYR